MEKHEAEKVAAAINVIRPDWPVKQIVTVLAEQRHRPARDVMLALAWCAWDDDSRTPARVNSDGPWWHTARLATATDPPLPPYHQHTPTHREPNPATPDQIRAIREAARKETR